MPAPLKDLTGRKWGYAAYLSDAGMDDNNERQCLCLCENCGKEFYVKRCRLLSGKIKHCGCLRGVLVNNKEQSAKWELCNEILNMARAAAGKQLIDKKKNPYKEK